MESFKQFFITELYHSRPIENEAMLILQKIINMVDNGHVDYGNNKIKINVGHLIKNKKYNGLYIFIIKGNEESKIGRHHTEEKHAIFLYTDKLPKHDKIDEFLSDKEQSSKFKSLFLKFYNDAIFDHTYKNPESSREKSTTINDRNNFEKSYVELVNKLNHEYSKYEAAKKEIDNKIKNASEDLGHTEILKMSLNNIKNSMIGDSANAFKVKAIDLYGKENYKLLTKENKIKLESRIFDYYEHKFE